MRIFKRVFIRKFFGALFTTIFLVSPLVLPSANASASQADVEYSQKVSTLSQEFVDVLNAWVAATANPPTFAVGKKFNTYKAKAIKSSDTVLVTLKKLNSLQPSEGFASSGPMLIKATTSYLSAINAIKNAINKNDSKLMKKANALALKAGTQYADWGKAYAKDMAALNG